MEDSSKPPPGGKTEEVSEQQWHVVAPFSGDLNPDPSLSVLSGWGSCLPPSTDWKGFLREARVGFSNNSLAQKHWGENSPALVRLEDLPHNGGRDQDDTLQHALLTSFVWNKAFLLDHVPKETRLTFVVGQDDDTNDTDKPGVSEVVWCKHPLHEDRVCDLCEADINTGEEYLHCEDCGYDLCVKCMDVTDVQRFRTEEYTYPTYPTTIIQCEASKSLQPPVNA